MGAVDDQLARIRDADGRLRSIARRGAGTAGIGLALTTALAGLASWGALAFGVRATHAGSLNGALLAVLALVPLAAFELSSPLPAATQAFQRARVAAGRVFEVMDAPPPVSEPRHPVATSAEGPHTVVLDSVWASYPAAGRAALRGVDLELRPGRRVALVGPEWRRQVDAGRRARALPSGRRRRGHASTASRWNGSRATTCGGSSASSSSIPTSSTPPWPRTSGSADAPPPTRSCTRCWPASGSGAGSTGCPTPWPPRWGLTAPASRVASASGWRWPAPCWPTSRSSCSTSPAEHLEPAAADDLTTDLLRPTDGRSTLLITHRLAGLERVDEIVVLDRGPRRRTRHPCRAARGRRPLRRPVVGGADA